jgi:hypothetical protein
MIDTCLIHDYMIVHLTTVRISKVGKKDEKESLLIAAGGVSLTDETIHIIVPFTSQDHDFTAICRVMVFLCVQ